MLSLWNKNFLDPFVDEEDFLVYPMVLPRTAQQQLAQARAQLGGGSQLAIPTIKDNKYNLNLDLRHFDPAEITVKVDQNSLQVSGKREKKSDDGAHYEFREYKHHFSVPDSVDPEQLKCQLDDKGYLRIEAPVKAHALVDKQRSIPIEYVKK